MIPTEILRIVKGIPRLPGDENSAEIKPDVFALHLDNAQAKTGFSLNPSIPWQPARAVVKPQQWIDSNRKDGRTLDGNAVSNVRETINVKAVAGTHLELVSRIARLQRMATDAQLFHASYYQIDPVYLEWSMKGGKGPQYALIYDIEIAVTYNDTASGGASADIVLVIEREPAWRGIPPGAHPKLWTYQWRDLPPQPYTEFDPTTATQSPLFSGSITNANEFEYSTDGYLYPSVSRNYVTIPAEDIPGDAPALVYILITGSPFPNAEILHISRSTKPASSVTRGGDLVQPFFSIPLADFSSVVNGTPTAAADGLRRASDGVRYMLQVAASTNGNARIGQPSSTYPLIAQNLRGKFNVFIRADSNGTPTGTLNYTMLVYQNQAELAYTIESPPISSPPTSNLNKAWHYIGVLDLPIPGSSQVAQDGRGVSYFNDLSFYIWLFWENGLTDTVDLYDMVFVPFDEPSVFIGNVSSATSDIATPSAYDSSGYTTHGKEGAIFINIDDVGQVRNVYRPVRGDLMVLQPGMDNTLVFWQEVGNQVIGATNELDIEVDIVPRWYGVRDD